MGSLFSIFHRKSSNNSRSVRRSTTEPGLHQPALSRPTSSMSKKAIQGQTSISPGKSSMKKYGYIPDNFSTLEEVCFPFFLWPFLLCVKQIIYNDFYLFISFTKKKKKTENIFLLLIISWGKGWGISNQNDCLLETMTWRRLWDGLKVGLRILFPWWLWYWAL